MEVEVKVKVEALARVYQSWIIAVLGLFLRRFLRDLGCTLDRSSRCTMASHLGGLDEVSK